jgi:hypothetical protein
VSTPGGVRDVIKKNICFKLSDVNNTAIFPFYIVSLLHMFVHTYSITKNGY